jgi:hypothetical protein
MLRASKIKVKRCFVLQIQGAAAISVESLGRCCEPGNENIVAVRGVFLSIHTKTDLHWLNCGGRSSLGES